MCKYAGLHQSDVDSADPEEMIAAIPARVDRRLLLLLCGEALDTLEACVRIQMDYYQDFSDARRISDRLDRVQEERERRKGQGNEARA